MAEAERDLKEERVKSIAIAYYARGDVQKAIVDFCRKRETVPRYFEGFGKRPDILEYSGDVFQLAKNGATSFHCSEELWSDPLKLKTGMSEDELNGLREGFDLLLDIDSKYMDFSKIAAELLIWALDFHKVKNIGVKFSGSKGYHIIIPWKAFPKEVFGSETRKMFPQWARAITQYLHNLIKKELINRVSELTIANKSYIKDYESAEKVSPDIVLVSSRHLFRTPYSLNEKTALASAVIPKEKLKTFELSDAHPLKVKIYDYLPVCKEGEAKELLLQALDWQKENTPKKIERQEYGEREDIKIDRLKIKYPPSIEQMLNGLKDGKKRALFVLINFFRYLEYGKEEMIKVVREWNEKNTPPLKEGYFLSQVDWAFRQKKRLPPNFDNAGYYKDLGIEISAEEARFKNPINYTIVKSGFRDKQPEKNNENKKQDSKE